jgi:hypothetical protein
MIKRLLFSAITILLAYVSFGQETTSQMLGSVSDGGTGLGGATVTALHVPTGTKYVTTTRKDGRFNLAGLRVGGPYTLTVSYVGFKTETQENINLSLGQDFTSDFKMTAESKELSSATVSAARQNKIFNNSHTGSQEIVNRSQLEQLPTVSRSLQDFTRLEPTATLNFGSQSFSGANPGMNNITVDGADFNNSFGLSGTLGGQASAQPIALDAIDQVQVNVSPYDVRQGGFTGAGVNSVTRGGTNQFRGSIYDYWKTQNNIGYKADDNVVLKTPLNLKVQGASFGGAIIPNKLFFFINGERSLQTAPATSTIASDATHSPSGTAVSQANADTLNALAAFLKTKYNYDPGPFQGYSFQTNSYKINARIDYNINNANTLTLKYNYLKSYQDQQPSTSRAIGAGGLIGGQGPGTFAMPFYSAGYRINNNLNIWTAELNTRFGNSSSNKLTVGYTRERDFRTPHSPNAAFPLVDIVTGGNVYTSFGYEPFTYNNVLNMDSYQLTDIYTMYKGAHEITIGSQNSYKKYANAFAPGYQGVYQFPSISAFENGGLATTYSQSYSTLKGGAFPFVYAGATNLSLFAQDKYRVTPNFTLIYGVRFDYTTYQNKFTDNPNFDQLSFKNGAHYNVGSAPSGFLVVSPRVGFNWDITGDRTWQLRGGAGIFEGAPPFVWIENQAANNGILLGSFNLPNKPFFPTAQGGLDNALAGQSQSATPTNYSINVIDKHFKYPTKLRTSVALDKKLPDDWIITGEFTYSADINATYMANQNLNEQKSAVSIANGPDNRTRYNGDPTATANYNATNTYYYQAVLANATLQNPNLGNVIWLGNSSKGWSYAATARISKTIRNFQVGASYTHQDVRSTMENGSTASTLWSTRAVANTDPNAATLGRPTWYNPNRVIAYFNWRKEYGGHFATSIGAVYEIQSNGATSYVYNGDLNGDGNTGNDLIYIPKSASEINLIDAGSYNKTTHAGSTAGTTADPRTAAQIWTQLSNFIQQDHYLYKHQGHYAQSNSVVLPYYKHLDLNVTEDVYFFTKNGSSKDKHTLRFSVDIQNVGNLLNRNWGVARSTNIANFLRFEGMSADNKTPYFSFPFSDAKNYVPLVNSFSPSTAIFSRWQMQFGVRYLFN